MAKEPTRSIGDLTTLDEFLTEEGKREEFEAVAIKEVLAWLAEAKTMVGDVGIEPTTPPV